MLDFPAIILSSFVMSSHFAVPLRGSKMHHCGETGLFLTHASVLDIGTIGFNLRENNWCRLPPKAAPALSFPPPAPFLPLKFGAGSFPEV